MTGTEGSPGVAASMPGPGVGAALEPEADGAAPEPAPDGAAREPEADGAAPEPAPDGAAREPEADGAAREPEADGAAPEPGMRSGDGVADLFGLLAYAELVAFFRLTEDACLAPSLAEKAALAEMAVAEFGHFKKLHSQLTHMGIVAEQAMLPFVAPLDAFHARTAPSDWLEGLVKAYVGDGLAADFYRAVAELLEPPAQALVREVLSDTGHAEFVIPRVRAAIEGDPPVAGRLALWARRLVGEGLAQAHRVVAERSSLAHLLAGMGSGREGSGQGEIGRMFARLTDAHDQRMSRLGLGHVL